MMFANRPVGRRWLAGGGLAVGLAIVLAAIPPAIAGFGAQALTSTPEPASGVTALIAVERAFVFPIPDRLAEPLTYLFERERVPVLAVSPDGVFLLTSVDGQQGWILRAQVELEGDLSQLERPVTSTPAASPTAAPRRFTPTPIGAATATAAPGQNDLTPAPGMTAAAQDGDVDTGDLPPVLPGAPPPLTIALPDGWEALDLVVPFRPLAGNLTDVPLTIYFGPLSGGARGFIYLYWGFPNVATLDGEINLWADGVQLLRGSLVGESCTLGLYEQKMFSIGGLEAVGASYQTSDCAGETDTAGWFGVVQVYGGSFAFYTAVEPLHAIVDQRDALQAILDSVEFLPPQEDE